SFGASQERGRGSPPARRLTCVGTGARWRVLRLPFLPRNRNNSMRQLPSVMAVLLGLTASAVAQNCTTPPAQRTFSNRDLFGSTNYSTLASYLFDLNAQ